MIKDNFKEKFNMMASGRNRSEGWEEAKITGHQNEEKVACLIEENPSVQLRLLTVAHFSNCTIGSVKFGGLHETDVDSVLGGKTKSKTDIRLNLSNGKRINVSVKKSKGGQVFLIGIKHFIDGFEEQYGKTVPSSVKRALSLYFGSADDTIEIINCFSGANMDLEIRKHRLVGDTLKAYDSSLYFALLNWFNDNIIDLFDFCFVRGLARNPEDWADIVWYKNMIKADRLNVDRIIYLPDFVNSIPRTVEYGTKNGGSTIQLPFGFVQWHSPRKIIPGSLQFHHNYDKILQLYESSTKR